MKNGEVNVGVDDEQERGASLHAGHVRIPCGDAAVVHLDCQGGRVSPHM